MALVFSADDLKVHREDVLIAGRRYVLSEASTADAAKYKNAQMAGLKLAKGKAVGVSGLASTTVLLVSLCLREAVGEGSDTIPIPATTIDSWPDKMTQQIFDRIREVSPSLKETERTAADIREQIKELQEELAELEEAEEARGNE